MWFPTEDEAVQLYARFLAARHGSAAEHHARRTAERLQAEGDHAGHAIWSRVADAVEQSKSKQPRRTAYAAVSHRDGEPRTSIRRPLAVSSKRSASTIMPSLINWRTIA